MNEPNYVKIISSRLSLSENQVKNVLKLIEEQNTIPFIARYRKEMTQNLDENHLREIVDLQKKEENLYNAKKTAINGIEEQGKLTSELKSQIENAKSLKEVEDIYAPYKRKKKTKAQIAIEKGFMPIAQQIKNQEKINISSELLDKYSKEEIIEGACDILIQEIVDDVKIKGDFRFYFNKYGEITSKYKTQKSLDDLPDKTKKQIHKFEIYDEFSADVIKIKGYQTLAINRGENLGILNAKLEKDDIPLENLEEQFIDEDKENVELLKGIIKKAYSRIFTSIETEIRGDLTKKAEDESIIVFQKNLKELLMRKPQYGNKILAIDPGFRTGCKIAVLDDKTNPVYFDKIYLEKSENAIRILKDIFSKYDFDYVVLGNGTGTNETFNLLKNNFECKIVVVDESGASVYSASVIGQEEFPNLDATDRGTVSIGRRFIDPLAELVKIPVHSIGVGMYQHDMNEKELGEKLGYVTEDVVNLVGINVNTASFSVLKYISGLNLRSAKKIAENKPYSSRGDLKKVLSKKAFEQSAGFLRIPESENKFDNTNIHPDQYKLADFIISKKLDENDFTKYESEIKKLYDLANEETIKDILIAYENIGRDAREHSGNLEIKETKEMSDLKENDILDGVVRNIMPFGVFVDIGVKNSGLVHISELADKFVQNPADIVDVGQKVKVKIISLDLDKGKIGLSMKQTNC